MANLRQRWNSDPEHLTQPGEIRDDSGDIGRGGGRAPGRAAGGALGGGRAPGRAAGGAFGGGTVAPGDNLPPGRDSYLDMDTIEENSIDGRTEKIKKKKRANGKPEKLMWMKTENSRFLLWMSNLLGILAIYSSVMAPLKCAFKIKDFSSWVITSIETVFTLDIIREWIYVYANDNQAMAADTNLFFRLYNLNPRKLETLALIPWNYLSYLMIWIKIVRALRVKELFEKFEKHQGLNFSSIRFLKLMFIQLYCVHIIGCLIYHLATTSDGQPEVYETWMSLIQIGDQNLSQLGKVPKYIASIYFATVTLSTVGYGDIHAVNVKEMVVVAGVIIFSLIVWTYLGVNFTNLFLRKSKAQIVGEKLDIMEKYLRKTNVNQDLATKMRDHMVIKYNDDYDNHNKFLEDVPASIRAKISRNFNVRIIQSVSLFCGCSTKIMKHLASEVREDFYPPGYTLLAEGSIVNKLYILFSGDLEQLRGGAVYPEHIHPTRMFGLESLVFNEALPNTFRACKTSKILTIRKHYLVEALETYLPDAAIVMNNLKRGRDHAFVDRLTHSEFGLRMEKDEILKASMLNHAVYTGNLYKVKVLVKLGVNVNSVDYCNISPLHVAATRGKTEIAMFLLEQGANMDIIGLNGTTPLLEAMKNSHDEVVDVLESYGAPLGIDNIGEYLCEAVSKNDLNLVERLLKHGIDPNARNDDGQAALHVAAAKGRDAIAHKLLSTGASHDLEDSWGIQPIDEAKQRKHWTMIEMLSKRNLEHGDQPM